MVAAAAAAAVTGVSKYMFLSFWKQEDRTTHLVHTLAVII